MADGLYYILKVKTDEILLLKLMNLFAPWTFQLCFVFSLGVFVELPKKKEMEKRQKIHIKDRLYISVVF